VQCAHRGHNTDAVTFSLQLLRNPTHLAG